MDKRKAKLLSITSVVGETLTSIRSVFRKKKIAWFLAGSYLFNDALVTVFAFLPLYARTTLHMSFAQIMVLFLVAQTIAFPSAYIIGRISDKRSQKNILLVTILVWIGIVLLVAFIPTVAAFYVAGILAGIVIGGSQAIIRSWYSKIIPKQKRSQFFGFNGFASKVAATAGPLIFGAVSSITGSQTYAILTLIPFFGGAFVIFRSLKE